jgi:Fe-S cluster biogenesis protein NfuA/nitrite reductase/ring-hydroxylating ferredoxin subunit
MNAPLSQTNAAATSGPDSAAELARIASQIAMLEAIAQGWDEHHAGTLAATKSAIEELNCEAFRRLIRFLREDPACASRLRDAVRDPFVFGVLRFHGLVKDPLEHRVEAALEEVRPYLYEHGGDVELVAIKNLDTVEVRLVGACHGCPASGQTLTEGVERSIRKHCPEVQHIHQVSRAPQQSANANPTHVVHFVSPFAKDKDEGWEQVCALAEIPDGGIFTHSHPRGQELLLYRRGAVVSCMNNACAHMGMPLDGGELIDGTMRCAYHGFTYLLETGECLTVPEVQLTMHAVKVVNDMVSVRLAR